MKVKIIIKKNFITGISEDVPYYIAEHKCKGLGIQWRRDYNKDWKSVHFYNFCPDCGCELPTSNEIEKLYLKQIISEFTLNNPENQVLDLLQIINESPLLK